MKRADGRAFLDNIVANADLHKNGIGNKIEEQNCYDDFSENIDI